MFWRNYQGLMNTALPQFPQELELKEDSKPELTELYPSNTSSSNKKLMLHDRFNSSQLPWWIEIKTNIPLCTYYFGPFDSLQEAEISQYGYIQDLVEEKARGITVEFKRGHPQILTIDEE